MQGAASLADFRFDGPLGDCRIKVGVGAVHVGDAATLSIRSGSGDIEVEHVRGHVDVTTGTATCACATSAPPLFVKNSNGDTWSARRPASCGSTPPTATLRCGALAGVSAKSANGDVRIGEVVRGAIVLETAAGDLEVGIREGTPPGWT